MKSLILKILLILSLWTMSFGAYAQAQSEQTLDPRIKALAIMAGYGAAGGFLLGTASLAFDAPGRAPFIGASLGLYAGILFGTYVVVTHAIKKHRMQNPGDPEDENYYPETPDSPYEGPFQSSLVPVNHRAFLTASEKMILKSFASKDEDGSIQSWQEKTSLRVVEEGKSVFVPLVQFQF